jgi:hypothetical protein
MSLAENEMDSLLGVSLKTDGFYKASRGEFNL